MKKKQSAYARKTRTALAKNYRENSLEEKRKKDIKHLNKWDDFRARRDIAIFEYLKAKENSSRCGTLVKQSKAFFVLRRSYLVFRNEQNKAIKRARKDWAHSTIVQNF